MSRTLRFTVIAFLFAAIVVLIPQPTPACGPYSLDAVFSFVVHPEFPLEKFARGEIGVVQPTFARSYLVVAYRNLNGSGFSDSEQKQLLALWQERLDSTWPDFDGSWPKPWLTARQMVIGVGPAPQISTSRHREKPNQYETYVNCQKDAFETAANTLTLRVKKFGADTAVMKDWVVAQDSVFANCSEGTHIPAAAPVEADSLIRADRAYQIAAANFYAGNFDEALKSFEAITRDRSSPWRQTATYLSARTWLRKASLGPAESKSEALTQAEASLKTILNDRALASVHRAANRLMNLARLRLHPETRVRELAHALQQKDLGSLKQDLWDYTVLLDDFIPSEEGDQNKTLPEVLRKDDLTDWIITIQDGGKQSLNHSLDRWQATSSMAWLVAALTKITSGHPQANAILAAAEKVSPASPAFASAAFHQIRLALEAGRIDIGRSKVEGFLANHRDRLPASSVNLFLGLRMRTAKNLAELLADAQRLPAGFTWNEDGRQMPADASEDSDLNKTIVGRTLFDLDGARVLNEKLPLTLLQQAAESKTLPEHLQRDVAQATWLRAVILDDQKRAREISPTLKSLVPAIVPLVDDYLAAGPADAMKFAGIYTWLKFPGLQPIVTAGVGRRSSLDKQDVYRDNWWCGASLTSAGTKEEQQTQASAPAITVNATPQSPLFVNEAQKTQARTEFARLSAVGAAPNYLCRQVIAWVEKHPSDPRAPEALHLAVKTTRYGCTDKETGKWSKAAYDLLHKKFPNNPWTKKTPYWFKD